MYMYRIVTDGIAEGLTLHDVIMTSPSWGAIAGKLKIVKCEACLDLILYNGRLDSSHNVGLTSGSLTMLHTQNSVRKQYQLMH